MMILISSMDRPAVGLRLPKLLILIAALWIVIPSRQLQTFIPTMPEERIIPLLIDAGILSSLTSADNPFPSATATYSTGSEM